MKLTFYLFNDSVTEFEQAIVSTKFEGYDAFQELKLKKELPFHARAYFQKNKPTTPKWLSFLLEHFDINPEDISNATNSFLLLVKIQDRILAITTGFGFTAIDRNRLEMGFGLRVALNEIDSKKIKEVNVRKIDTTTKQKRVLLNRDSPLHDFDFDVDEDLLNLIAGQPRNGHLARKLIGSDSLSITGDLNIIDLGKKCEALLQAFLKTDYRNDFAFIDHLRIVKDQNLKQELETKLINGLVQRQTEKLMLAYPDIDNLNQIEQFKFIYQGEAYYAEEADLQAVYDFLDSSNFGNIDPKKLGIIGLDHNQNALTKGFSLYDYIVFETDHKGKRYILTLSRWFELAGDYVQQVEMELNSIEEITDPNFLPFIRRGQKEDDYNANAKGFVLLDKKNYPAGGYSRIEVADLLSPQGEFICVKKYNGSSTLSHLFSQGFVSATLFNDQKAYRDFILSKCPSNWPILFNANDPDKSKITFIFAIASETSGTLTEALPFFSKINLRQARKSIERLGFKVALYKIAYQSI